MAIEGLVAVKDFVASEAIDDASPGWATAPPELEGAADDDGGGRDSTGIHWELGMTDVEIVKQASVFQDPELRRGMPLSAVLACFGRIFSSSFGSDGTFAMSAPVDRLDYFISHNWTVGRYPKFLSLAFQLNCPIAGAFAMVCFVLAFILDNFVVEVHGYIGFPCMAVFLLALVGTPAIGRGVAFLDKTCIHQTDKVLQRQGIEALGAYLSCSKEMLVLYTEAYLNRLWTVYELASMIILEPDASITVIPVELVISLYKIMVSFLGVLLLLTATKGFIAQVDFLANVLYLVIMGTLNLFLIFQLRRWAREREVMMYRAETFEIRKAVCAVESDRQVVERNVAAMMRFKRLVPVDADDSACLDTFDFMVRDAVPGYLSVTWGRFGVPWRFTVSFAVMAFSFGMDVKKLQVTEPKHAAYWTIYCATTAFAFIPLLMAFMAMLARQCLCLEGTNENMLVAGLWIPAMLAPLLALLLVNLMRYTLLPHAVMGWIVLFLPPLVACVLALAVYRPWSPLYHVRPAASHAELRRRSESSQRCRSSSV